MTDDSFAVPAAPARPPSGVFRSPTAKFFLITLLTVLLTVPLMMVWALTSEREGRRDEVLFDVARDWGGSQVVIGPVLVVPYALRPYATGDAPVRKLAAFLPESFTVTANTPVEARGVSIFTAAVYTAETTLSGRFGPADAAVFGDGLLSVDWSRARLVVGITDVGGIEVAALSAGGADLTPEPGAGLPGGDLSGIHVDLPAALTGPNGGVAAAGFPFEFKLRLRGSDRLTIAPVGRQSEIRMASTWPHPGFQVGALPSERTIEPTGFSAVWRIPYLARSVPQAFDLEGTSISRLGDDAVGAAFAQPVDHYALVERALKYGFMFVAALLGLVFVIEILSPRRIHVVQYALVGLILVFFYVLLLALAEQVGFALAYGASSAATVAVVSAFVGTALSSRGRGAAALAGFTAVFAVLYVILELEDLALLAGAVTGFLVLTTVLFATRRVDWSGSGDAEPPRRTATPPPTPTG